MKPTRILLLTALTPLFALAQLKGYRIAEKLRYAYADSVEKGKYHALEPVMFFGDSAVMEVYTNGNIFLHDLMYTYSSSINGIELVSEERHHYFVYSKDSVYGYDWNGYEKGRTGLQRKRIDSVLGESWKNGFISRYEHLFQQPAHKMVSSKSNPDSGTLIETYDMGYNSDTCKPVMVYVHYAKNENKGVPAPARLPGMYVTYVRAFTECRPCQIEITYDLRPVAHIRKNIEQIFKAYIDNKLEFKSSSYGSGFF